MERDIDALAAVNLGLAIKRQVIGIFGHQYLRHARPRHSQPRLSLSPSWIKGNLKASLSQLRIVYVAGDSMAPTLLDGDTVLVDMTCRAPNPPGIFVLDDGMGLVAKRLEHIPNSDPPAGRVISVTRGKKLVGQAKAVAIAVKNVTGLQCWTKLG